MIEGYTGRETVEVGSMLRLHVSTDAPFFRVDFYRLGEELEFLGSSDWRTGVHTPPPPHPDGRSGHASPADDWNWPEYVFPVPRDWRPGIHIARFVEGDTSGRPSDPPRRLRHPSGFEREFFIVRPSSAGSLSRILYKKSTFTRHAYNRSDRSGLERACNLYENPVYANAVAGTGTPKGHKVSMRRPGGINDLGYWDAPFIGWLERNGYDVEYCGDLDLHEDPELLHDYDLLLSVGHDEYWSQGMRTHVESFVRSGGNVAFFSANTCWWRVHLTDGGTAFVSDTDHEAEGAGPPPTAADLWWRPAPGGVGVPENSLTGVSFRNGGVWPGDWPGDRPCPGFTVQHADHWVYEGTGLADGTGGGTPDVFASGVPLIGYECDGAAFTYDEHGVARAHGMDGTPESFLILGIALLHPPNREPHALRSGHWGFEPREERITSPRAATMGVHTAGGTVFTAATTDWPRVVGLGLDPAVDRITRNVLDRLRNRRSGA
ncbi:N,N-dimethylformamidase beta subunit family domain-containing protein [Streptomyces sp. NPDC050355]|uniref:N,N-dimethylformamidase beta subunit family domain-containing protein n=1 Tax=Streptomyces sp. NPDC050355 TaxID=3365609 RepID=UPI0037AF969E